MDGVISSYTCTNPTLGLENGLSAPPVVFNCDEYVIDNTGLNILWYGDPSFDSQAVQWYRHYISHQSSFEKQYATTYLLLEPTSNSSYSTTLRFSKANPKWEGSQLADELEDLLHLLAFVLDSEHQEKGNFLSNNLIQLLILSQAFGSYFLKKYPFEISESRLK